MSKPTKRVNKTKAELEAQIKHNDKIERQKLVAKLLWPFIADMKSVYDAQTVLQAVAGYMKYDLVSRETKLSCADLSMDLTKEKESEIKTAMQHVFNQLATENAKDSILLLETMANKLPEFIATKHLKDPMSTVKVEEFIA